MPDSYGSEPELATCTCGAAGYDKHIFPCSLSRKPKLSDDELREQGKAFIVEHKGAYEALDDDDYPQVPPDRWGVSPDCAKCGKRIAAPFNFGERAGEYVCQPCHESSLSEGNCSVCKGDDDLRCGMCMTKRPESNLSDMGNPHKSPISSESPLPSCCAAPLHRTTTIVTDHHCATCGVAWPEHMRPAPESRYVPSDDYWNERGRLRAALTQIRDYTDACCPLDAYGTAAVHNTAKDALK